MDPNIPFIPDQQSKSTIAHEMFILLYYTTLYATINRIEQTSLIIWDITNFMELKTMVCKPQHGII